MRRACDGQPALSALNCGPGLVDFGNGGHGSARVIATYVAIDNGVWTVKHTLAGGEVIDRSTQYIMRNTSTSRKTQWVGDLLPVPKLYMAGEVQTLNATGQPTYQEWLYDR